MAKPSELSPRQPTKAVLALLRREEPAARIAPWFEISEQTLYRWRDEFLAAGEAAMASRKSAGEPKARQIADLEKRICSNCCRNGPTSCGRWTSPNVHIPGYGWWYAVTVIDYFSRYVLACHLKHSYSATEVSQV